MPGTIALALLRTAILPRILHRPAADPTPLGEAAANYNDSSPLCDAIRAGARGAFWDILRRMA